jgi:uncharacterized protein YdeI (YjbR/CyaY-like superfamily)
MIKKDARVDKYISESADFAQPILIHLRGIIHKTCPDVEEVIKWGFPNFSYKGNLCSIASFKNHCSFGFWKASLMKDPDKIFSETGANGMGHLGKITSLKDLPKDKILISCIKEAMALNEAGAKVKKEKPAEKKELEVPGYFLRELSRNKKAEVVFDAFSYSHKKEYVEWITEAKTEATRNRRIETSIQWLAEGKSRMWKYQKK